MTSVIRYHNLIRISVVSHNQVASFLTDRKPAVLLQQPDQLTAFHALKIANYSAIYWTELGFRCNKNIKHCVV